MKATVLNAMRSQVQSFKKLLKIRELYIPYLGGTNNYCIPKTTIEISEQRYGRMFPVPPKNLLLGYSNDQEKYLQAGERDVDKMFEIIQSLGKALPDAAKILDFGCGSGRMIRWIGKHTQNATIFGTDIDGNNIAWCRANLRPEITFMVNTTVPHLPFEDNLFDFIYSGSVFTHIEDTTESWLAELRRVIKPGGFLYITIHDHETIRILENEWKGTSSAMTFKPKSQEDYNNFSKSNFSFFTINRWNDSQVFYDIPYFKDMVKPFFDILSITERAYGKQTGVLLSKS